MTLHVSVVDRGELVDIFRGIHQPSAVETEMKGHRLPVPVNPQAVALIYAGERRTKLPNIIVIPSDDKREFYAWANTYMRFATPLSQSCHVVAKDDLPRISAWHIAPDCGSHSNVWAGVVIGEALLRTRMGDDLSQLSLMALQSSISFVGARAIMLWGSDKIRARSIENYDSALALLGAERATVPDYKCLWAVLDAISGGGVLSMSEAQRDVELIVECCEGIGDVGFVRDRTMSKVLSVLSWPPDLSRFGGADAEERVQVFKVALERLFDGHQSHDRGLRALAEFVVAYFAARIGGSASSRTSLLADRIDAHPMLALWYGLVSALHEPYMWGAEFGGLARLALRELSFPHRFEDPPRCDIAFEELLSLVDSELDGPEFPFRGAMNKSLIVEVEHGVNATVRVGSRGEEGATSLAGRVTQSDVSALRRHLENAMDVVDYIEGTNAGSSSKRDARRRNSAGKTVQGRRRAIKRS